MSLSLTDFHQAREKALPLPLKKLSKRSRFDVFAVNKEGLRVDASCATIGEEATDGGRVLEL